MRSDESQSPFVNLVVFLVVFLGEHAASISIGVVLMISIILCLKVVA